MADASGKSSSRNITVSKHAVEEAFNALSNWGRWGKDDQIGTLNHITPEDVVGACKLVRRGKVFALGIPLAQSGPQRGLWINAARRISMKASRLLLHGAPSAPSETWTPSAASSGISAMPEASFRFELGQCRRWVPVSRRI